MARQKSPHTSSEQNISFEQTDMEPDLEQRLGRGDESELPGKREAAQTGGTRSPKRPFRQGPRHKTEPAPAAYEGPVTTRPSRDRDKQGFSSHSSAEQSARQQKVVNSRDDVQAGVNRSGKQPRRRKAA